jgi:hypothetical protein
MALPVFSARTHKSVGCGEFLDLLPLVEFADAAGMRLIQVRVSSGEGCCAQLLLLQQLWPQRFRLFSWRCSSRQRGGER